MGAPSVPRPGTNYSSKAPEPIADRSAIRPCRIVEAVQSPSAEENASIRVKCSREMSAGRPACLPPRIGWLFSLAASCNRNLGVFHGERLVTGASSDDAFGEADRRH
jgi:hypothetical protein